MVAGLYSWVRIGRTNDRFEYDYDTGGTPVSGTITLTHGLYDHDALESHLTLQLFAVSGTWQANRPTFNESNAWRFVDTAGKSFDITWSRPALRDWLGFGGDLSGSSDYTGGDSPGAFRASLTWSFDGPGKRWHRKSAIWQHQRGGSLVLGSLRLFQPTLRAKQPEVAQLQRVLSQMARGMPATLYRDHDFGTSWDFDNLDGTSDVILESPEHTPQWTHRYVNGMAEFDVRFVEYSA